MALSNGLKSRGKVYFGTFRDSWPLEMKFSELEKSALQLNDLYELSDCLCSIIVFANKCGVDLGAEFSKNVSELAGHVSGELKK